MEKICDKVEVSISVLFRFFSKDITKTATNLKSL